MSTMPVLTIALLACLLPVALLVGGAVIGLFHVGRDVFRRFSPPPAQKSLAG